MTARQSYEACLVELDKVQAPTILLDDYNYLINKVVSDYVNALLPKKESIKQEDVDRLGPLVSSAELDVEKKGDSFIYLPDDYLHLLSCFCSFSEVGNGKCGNGDVRSIPARHMNPARVQEIRVNEYLKPKATRPYYRFMYENAGKRMSANNADVDIQGKYNVTSYLDKSGDNSNFRREFLVDNVEGGGDRSVSVVDREIAVRYGNPTRSKLFIEHGGEGYLTKVEFDYVKAPQHIRLYPEQMDLVEDTSQILEWNDLVCYELINNLVAAVKAANNLQT